PNPAEQSWSDLPPSLSETLDPLRSIAFDKLAEDAPPDYYAILSVSPTASSAEIKQAYHQALLIYHPDKQHSQRGTSTSDHSSGVDIALLQRAYQVLASPADRVVYDVSRTEANTKGGPRPAQVVSLEEFEEGEDGAERVVWTYACRCGGGYIVTEEVLEDGQHLIGCNSCSEVVWVGYEVAEDEEEDMR
ncbi:DnaJ domain-containing protein, partial [Rhodofomes roseus]